MTVAAYSVPQAQLFSHALAHPSPKYSQHLTAATRRPSFLEAADSRRRPLVVQPAAHRQHSPYDDGQLSQKGSTIPSPVRAMTDSFYRPEIYRGGGRPDSGSSPVDNSYTWRDSHMRHPYTRNQALYTTGASATGTRTKGGRAECATSALSGTNRA